MHGYSPLCIATSSNPLHPREGYTLEIDETIYSPTDSCPSEDTFYEIELETVRLPFRPRVIRRHPNHMSNCLL